MRLFRFVAVALMVTVSVASFGCGEATTVVKPAETESAPANGSSTESAATEAATSGATPVSLTITGMT